MKIFYFLLFLGANILLFQTPLIAQDKPGETTFEWRTRMDDQKTSKESLKAEFDKLKNINTSEAKAKLAYLYMNGKGTYGDLEKAITLLKEVESENDPFANFLIGYFFYHGLSNVPKDVGQAAARYETAAKLGNVYGQFALAQIYHAGREHIKRDPIQAAYWYQAAADQGYQRALKYLGDVYFYQLNDLKSAKKWYTAACEMETEGNESCHGLLRINSEIHYAKIKTYLNPNNPEWEFIPERSTNDRKYYLDLRLVENKVFHEQTKQVLIKIHYAEPQERHGKKYDSALFAWLIFCKLEMIKPNFARYYYGEKEVESERLGAEEMKIGDDEELNYIFNKLCK